VRRGDRDRAAFEQYVVDRRPALVRTAYLLCGDRHLAEDLVQSALVKAVGHWKRIGDNPEPWVRRVIVNDNISRWRRHRGRERSPTRCRTQSPSPMGATSTWRRRWAGSLHGSGR
jgi:DNA-directed RNA polymerase specialized sigma24 family protein